MVENKNKVKEIFDKTDFKNIENKVWVVAELLGIEETGFYDGIDQDIVLAKTSRGKNKELYIWVVFPSNSDIKEKILNKKLLFIEGYMGTSYTFNNRAVSHTFIVPEEVQILEDNIELEKKEEFYLNYTINNRVVLEGEIDRDPWREFIPPANNYVTRFSIKYKEKGKFRSMYCTVWDTVNDVKELKKGKNIKVIGSFSLLKKERGLKIKDGKVIEAKKNKLDSYVIVVQRIEFLNSNNDNEITTK